MKTATQRYHPQADLQIHERELAPLPDVGKVDMAAYDALFDPPFYMGGAANAEDGLKDTVDEIASDLAIKISDYELWALLPIADDRFGEMRDGERVLKYTDDLDSQSITDWVREIMGRLGPIEGARLLARWIDHHESLIDSESAPYDRVWPANDDEDAPEDDDDAPGYVATEMEIG